MKKIPITFCYNFSLYEEARRRQILHEFAVNGAKHMVLTDRMVKQIMAEPEWADILNREMAAEGLTFVDSHAPFGAKHDLYNLYPEDFDALILRHKLHLNIAALMNVDTIAMHIGNDNICPEIPKPELFDRTCRVIDALLPEAEKCGVVIGIENAWTPSNTADVMLKIKKEFPSDYLGFCYDSGHANIMENGKLHSENNADIYWHSAGVDQVQWDDQLPEKLQSDIVNCHLHDNRGDGDEHRLPGIGIVNWQRVVNILKHAPRLRSIQSEVSIFYASVSVKELVNKFNSLFC